jgi:Peptidase C10 family/Spi protease inhibitor/Secretion system C-terminal sorting domain
MKKYLLLIAITALLNTAFATKIDINYAQQVAQNFYLHTTGKKVTMVLAYQSINNGINNGVATGEPLFYAFNVEGDKGFVLISADNVVKPVLGYSTESQFKIAQAPAGVLNWFEKYSKQIAFAKANISSATTEVTAQWNNIYNNLPGGNQLKASAVGPLCKTTWDQDLYYNALCPSDASSPYGYGGNVPTGCGATAMSQIMRYWSYPAQGTGSNSYNSNYGTLSANFASTTYNWANMPFSVTSANNDVATIMYDCGVAVDMIYGPDESASYLLSGGVAASCQAAYTTYFGYDPNTIQGLQKSNYAESDWLNLIQADLNAGRPIQYAGSGSQGGHTFVLDGSDGNGNYHINWGWSGADNGYYGIDALIPGPQPNGEYDQNEQMVTGIQPLNVTPVASSIDLYAAITVTPNPIAFLQTFTVTTNVINDGSSAFDGSYCAALFDASGNFIRYIGDILSTNGSPLNAGYYYNNGLTFSDTTAAITVPGTYIIGIYYQPTGSNIWNLAGASSYTNPINVTINGPTNSNITLYSAISTSPSTFVQGQPGSVTVNVVNNGSATYYGQYEAVLLDFYGNVVELIGTLTESTGLQPNYDYTAPYLTFSTNNITAPEGQYILAIAEEQQGTSSWYYCGTGNYQNPILVAVINNGFTVSVNDVTEQKIKIYPNPASNHITINTADLNGDYTLKIINTVGQDVMESNGQFNGQAINADVSDFAAGMYVVQLKTESGTFNARVVVK